MSRDIVKESVPRLDRRVGDHVIAGANNATIVLGRDRIDSVSSGYGSALSADGGKGAGAIHMAVGRRTEDPSVESDPASLYLSERSDPDRIVASPGPAVTSRSSLIGRADCVRVSAREDIKISVGKAYITMNSSGQIIVEGDIALEENASQSIMRGEAFSAFWNNVRVPTPAGLSGPLPPIPPSIFTKRSKVK